MEKFKKTNVQLITLGYASRLTQGGSGNMHEGPRSTDNGMFICKNESQENDQSELGKASKLTLGGKGNLVENFHNSNSRGIIHKS